MNYVKLWLDLWLKHFGSTWVGSESEKKRIGANLKQLDAQLQDGELPGLVDRYLGGEGEKLHYCIGGFLSIVAGMRVSKPKPNGDSDAFKAWGEVQKAVVKYGSYYEASALKSLSPCAKKVCQYFGWDFIVETYDKDKGRLFDQFRYAYREISKGEIIPDALRERGEE